MAEFGQLSGAGLINTLKGLSRFREILQEFDVHTCYLFGSRMTGQTRSDSDIDFAVLFSDFDPDHHHLDHVIHLEAGLSSLLAPVKVEVIGLQGIRDIALRFEIISTSAVLYCTDDEARTDFEEMVLRDYQDFKPVLDMYYKEMEEEILGF